MYPPEEGICRQETRKEEYPACALKSTLRKNREVHTVRIDVIAARLLYGNIVTLHINESEDKHTLGRDIGIAHTSQIDGTLGRTKMMLPMNDRVSITTAVDETRDISELSNATPFSGCEEGTSLRILARISRQNITKIKHCTLPLQIRTT